MKALLIFALLCSLSTAIQAYPGSQPTARSVALELYHALDEDQQQKYFRAFDDGRRKTWERLPREREGLKLADLTEQQKYIFHRFLQASLSSEGYLMVTSVMFNEDIQQRFEPYLGRNEYFIELFGMPEEGSFWGWQLEGHHLSVNLTFKGDELISHTPFLLASNPQIVNSDRDRNGLCLLYLEEQLAGELAESLEGDNRLRGYSEQTRPSQVFGEKDKTVLQAPDEGVRLAQLNAPQQEMASTLAQAYMRYFKLTAARKQALLKELTSKQTLFYFMQNTPYNQEHYYRLYSPATLIECENYGNHSHHFWRSANDFGETVLAAGK